MRIKIPPEPPQWALDAGMPEHKDGEPLDDYCARIGFSEHEVDALFDGLTLRTISLVHLRFESLLIRTLPDVWQQYLDRRIAYSRAKGNGAGYS